MNLKTFKTLQHNIACILHINSSNKIFCSIHDFTFLMTDTNVKGQVSFESSEKKETFACAIFSKICYCYLRWQIDLPACLPAQAR